MEEVNEKQVAEYYDSYSDELEQIGINIRHYTIFKKSVKAGLKRDHNVLEIGCGIGTYTKLMAKYMKRGSILGVDISPESIAKAKKFVKHKNIDFMVSDMSDFKVDRKFDFIICPDVLEHIPIAQHRHLFEVFKAHSHENTIILIHIPHPLSIELMHRKAQHRLQVIDQSLYSDKLLADVYANGFYLHELISYSMYDEQPDYQFITLYADKLYPEERPLSKMKIVKGKYMRRLYYMLKSL